LSVVSDRIGWQEGTAFGKDLPQAGNLLPKTTCMHVVLKHEKHVVQFFKNNSNKKTCLPACANRRDVV
jgi:hypothetical protein